jgi:hypothetical protein
MPRSHTDFKKQIRTLRDFVFPIKGEPKQARPGDLMFFVQDDRVFAVGFIDAIVPNGRRKLVLQQGKVKNPERYYRICVHRIRRLEKTVACDSFTGFRYGHRLDNELWVKVWDAGKKVLKRPFKSHSALDSDDLRLAGYRYDIEAKRVSDYKRALRAYKRSKR